MIDTNLSTRPFYNERLVRTLLLLFSAIVIAVTALNAFTIADLSQRDKALGGATSDAERRADRARRDADRVRRSIDAQQLKTVASEAVEANDLIDRRTFSWTQLLGEFESALPPEVRVASVQPRVDRDGRMRMDVVVLARKAEDVNAFAEKLEARGAFMDLLLRQESVNQEGLLEATLSGQYVGKARIAGREARTP